MRHHAPILRSLFAKLLVVFALSIVPAFSQVTTGDITGRVVDSQGAVVPGVTVTAVNKGTSFSRAATTDSTGVFTIAQLPPGRYDVTVQAQGFSKALVQDFELNVGTRPTLNFELKPGQITAEISVTGEAPLVETTTSELGGVVTPSQVQN